MWTVISLRYGVVSDQVVASNYWITQVNYHHPALIIPASFTVSTSDHPRLTANDWENCAHDWRLRAYQLD